jgi:hypothetical protein
MKEKPKCNCPIGEPRHFPSCPAYDQKVIDYLNAASGKRV